MERIQVLLELTKTVCVILLQCMTDTSIERTTAVISVSLPPQVLRKLENEREKYGQTRSAFIVSLIKRYTEDKRWERIYARGEETAKKFGITSEEDIERILNER